MQRRRQRSVERPALRASGRLGGRAEISRWRSCVDAGRRRHVDIVLGLEGCGRPRRRIQGDLRARRFLPAAERRIWPLPGRLVLLARCLRRRPVALWNLDRGAADHVAVCIDDTFQSLRRLLHVLADGLSRVPRPWHLPRLHDRPGRGRRLRLGQCNFIFDAGLSRSERDSHVRIRRQGRRKRPAQAERAVPVSQRSVRGNGRLSIREFQTRSPTT